MNKNDTDAQATAHANIALFKYWGKYPSPLNLPAVGSISMTLDFFKTTTHIAAHSTDRFILNAIEETGPKKERVFSFIDLLLTQWGITNHPFLQITSVNTVPTAAGLASSSSGFCALTIACGRFFKQAIEACPYSMLARQGSASAARSMYGGIVALPASFYGEEVAAEPLLPKEATDPLRMIILEVETGEKPISSRKAMQQTARTSPFYSAWLEWSHANYPLAKEAVLKQDWERVGTLMEQSTLSMHATMLAAQPSILYWRDASLRCMEAVKNLRKKGFFAFFTLDAGANVKVLCKKEEAPHIATLLQRETDVRTLHILGPGPGALESLD